MGVLVGVEAVSTDISSGILYRSGTMKEPKSQGRLETLLNKMLFVSNRLPVSVQRRKGRLHFQNSVGGLATGLSSFYETYDSLWIGWPGVTSAGGKTEENQIRERLAAVSCHPVFLSQDEVRNHYQGFCNRTIWPLFHYFTQYAVYDDAFWEAYQRVNEHFCDAVVGIAQSTDTIWIHDYHLMLLPSLVREKLPDAEIGFFLHTPFPSSEIFRLLPWRKEILEGLLGADLIGFHTYGYVRHFINSARYLLGHEHTMGQLNVGNRVVKVDAFPMGIDYDRFFKGSCDRAVQEEADEIREKAGKRRLIFSIDRLDYTKGILQRLQAFDRLLTSNPEFKENVHLMLAVVPSRTKVEHYLALKRQIDEHIGEINGKHGSIGWVPIWYSYRSLPFRTLLVWYCAADVALITPLRDGMNLVAKEFVASKCDGKGVLILSEVAGAAEELSEAILVNPNDQEDIVAALKEALSMPEQEQIARNRLMQDRLGRHNVVKWAEEFINELTAVKSVQSELAAHRVNAKVRRDLIRAFRRSKARLFLLDYDGTLVPLVKSPEEAKPDAELLSLLCGLLRTENTELVIISGRDKETLGDWFGDLNIGLIAEHGAWFRAPKAEWETLQPLSSQWKPELKPILRHYVDRTPGSFVEEKDFSLVWHYRRVDPALAERRLSELKDTLLQLAAAYNLAVLEGNKVIEIKNSGVDKGQAALRWLSKGEWDFILAVGDDRTDEDLFGALPRHAYSICVGIRTSQARFNVGSPRDVCTLLQELRAG